MQKLQKLKHIFVVSILSLGAVFASIYGPVEITDPIMAYLTYRTGGDVWQDRIYTHTLKPSSEIAIIRIDNESLNALQAKSNLKMLSIPKSQYVTLIEKLESVGVKGIAFDIIFENTDKDEALFAQTLKKYSNIVIAAGITGNAECVKDKDGLYENCSGVPRSVYKDATWGSVDMGEKGNPERRAFMRFASTSIEQAPYASWKKGSGSLSADSLIIDTLPLALYKKVQSGSLSTLTLNQLRRSTLNPYFGAPDSYSGASFSKVVEMGRATTLQAFQNKYIFIGESGTAIHDAMTSPVTGTSMDGVESHAHYLDGILQSKMLSNLGSTEFMSGIIGLTLLMVILYFSLPGYMAFPLSLIAIFGGIYGIRYGYDVLRVVVDVVPVLVALFGTFIIVYIYRFFIVDREKRQLKSNFAHYIDPKVVDDIANRGESIELGGEKRELSVLFSDIAGFTTISEKLDPRDLFYLMTSYLSNMTDILIREKGTLDKFIGDAVMGFFGAPLAYSDHAIHAANTALLMREALPDFNKSIQKHGLDPIDFRVGIATGQVMVGNIGSHDRFNYTVLGDTVNLASRLEGTGKEYDVHIILSHATKIGLSPLFFTRELDTIAVKGKNTGVKIHELVGYSLDYPDRNKYIIYERALGLYRAGDYREAGKLWQSQAEIDPPSRIMMLRCAEALKGNIQIENGIYHMTHK